MIIFFMSIILLSLGKSTLSGMYFQNKQTNKQNISGFWKEFEIFPKAPIEFFFVISLEGRASDIRLQEIKGRNV